MRIFAAKLVMRGSYARAVVSPIETPNRDLEAPRDTNGDNVYELTDAASDGSLSDTQGAVGDGHRRGRAATGDHLLRRQCYGGAVGAREPGAGVRV